MTQYELDVVFGITSTIYMEPWFKEKERTLAEVQAWVAEQLAFYGIFTVPVGASWGILTNKETYDDRQLRESPSIPEV